MSCYAGHHENVGALLEASARQRMWTWSEGVAPLHIAAMRGQAEKRVVIRVKPDKRVSWDHSKLGGVY